MFLTEQMKEFLEKANELRKNGLTEGEIVRELGLKSIVQYRRKRSIALEAKYRDDYATAKRYFGTGHSTKEVAQLMNCSESHIRGLLRHELKSKEPMNSMEG